MSRVFRKVGIETIGIDHISMRLVADSSFSFNSDLGRSYKINLLQTCLASLG